MQQYSEFINLKHELQLAIKKLNQSISGAEIHIFTQNVSLGNFLYFYIDNENKIKKALNQSEDKAICVGFDEQKPKIKECNKYSQEELEEFSSIFHHLKQ